MPPVLAVQLLRPWAKMPTYGSDQAIGLDLYFAPENRTFDYILESGQRELLGTGIAIQVPEGYYGRVAPRSGLALRFGVDVLAGVIDPDYRGEVGVILVNLGNSPFEIKPGDRIAQLIIEKAERVHPLKFDNLDDTSRAGGGFGSTGA